jgi:hypothetical protein
MGMFSNIAYGIHMHREVCLDIISNKPSWPGLSNADVITVT